MLLVVAQLTSVAAQPSQTASITIDARKVEQVAEARTITFKKAALAYFKAHQRNWRNAKYRVQFLPTLEAYIFPKIGALPIAAVDDSLVFEVIEPIRLAKTKLATNLRAQIESVLKAAPGLCTRRAAQCCKQRCGAA